MSYAREHELASEHALALKGKADADKAIARARKAMRRKAEKLRAKAQAMLDEASELEYVAGKTYEYDTPFAKMREEIEDKAYWAAREQIGTFARDENGDYVDPAPLWVVHYNGQNVGEFQGDDRTEVLRQVCPPRTDERRWSDFEVVRKIA